MSHDANGEGRRVRPDPASHRAKVDRGQDEPGDQSGPEQLGAEHRRRLAGHQPQHGHNQHGHQWS